MGFRSIFNLAACTITAVLLFGSAVLAQSHFYQVQPIPAPEGWYLTPVDMSDSGIVTGSAFKPDGTGLPFLWSADTGFRLVGEAQPGVAVIPAAVNNTGGMVGRVFRDARLPEAMIISVDGRLIPAGSAGGVQSTATGINNAGTIIGYGPDEEDLNKGFIRMSGQRVALIPTLGGRWSTATAINDMGSVAGTAEDEAGRAVGYIRLTSGGIINVDPGLGNRLTIRAINNEDEVVGIMQGTGEAARAFYAGLDAVPDALPHALGAPASEANDINDVAQVVGRMLTPGGGQRAFIWQAGMEEMKQLDRLAEDRDSHIFTNAVAINNDGEILVQTAGAAEGAAPGVAILIPRSPPGRTAPP